MMWRQCVVLLVVLAWHVSSASELINLIEPSVARWAPRTDLRRIKGVNPTDPNNSVLFEQDAWKLMDNDHATFVDVGNDIKFFFVRKIRPTRVRITLAPHVRERDLPRTWYMKNSRDYFAWTRVNRPAVENGVIDLVFEDVVDSKFFLIMHQKRTPIPIAEIELLGTREALDALWPYGTYPCSQRLEMITPKTGPKGTLFSVAKNALSQQELRRVFTSVPDEQQKSLTTFIYGPSFDYDGGKPVIIGVKFSEIPTVNEIMVHGLRWYYMQGVEKMVLEGHDCQPSCSKGGSKGWVTLEERMTPVSYRIKTLTEPFYLATPGEYKAYRVKFYPRTYANKNRPRIPSMKVGSIFFLGCKAD